MKNSIRNPQQDALDQKVDAQVVKKVQEQLIKLNEYMGQPTGEIDAVTVNAIEAFQRSKDLKPSGLIDQGTLSALDKAVSGKG